MATIQELEERLDSFEASLLQMQRNMQPVTDRADTAYNGVQSLTPYTETKTAYIGDTSVTFTDIQKTAGNLSVFFDNDNIRANYIISRFMNSIIIEFLKPLEEVTEVTISIS